MHPADASLQRRRGCGIAFEDTPPPSPSPFPTYPEMDRQDPEHWPRVVGAARVGSRALHSQAEDMGGRLR